MVLFVCLQRALPAASTDGSGVKKHQTGTDSAHRDAGKVMYSRTVTSNK